MAFDGDQTRIEKGAHQAKGFGRRSDLDWLRVIAFGLLILFHVGLVYAPFDWHAHSRHTEDWLRQGILITGPWRLTLLFFISGCALKLMSRKLNAPQVLKARFARLVPPFLFGVLVLVPPQAYIENFDKAGFHGNLIDWYAYQFGGEGLSTSLPVNHMWFVLYILVYSVLATALIALPRVQARISQGLGWAMGSVTMLAVPILYLTLVRQGLFLRYGISNHLSTDWYNHAVSFGVFLFGFLIVGQDGFWTAARRWRWLSLVVAVLALPMLMIIESVPATAPEDAWTSFVFAADQWATIAAVLGFGVKYLQDRDGPVLRYLTQAVFPCYLAHQTILVAAVWFIRPAGLPASVEAPLLIAIVVGGCLTTYEVVRRFNLIRPLWGLKRLPKSTLAAEQVLEPTPDKTKPPTLTAEAA
jgi:membrane-bound acyltransferase YfiQ involved in biofilm formation